MSSPVILILGAGAGIGLSVARAFAAQGYKVALAARSIQDGIGEDGYLRMQVDFANTPAIQGVFSKVKETFGIPSVVVYNAYAREVRDPADPLGSITVDQFNHEYAVNVTAVFFAAQEAVRGFKQLPSSASKTFIATGNKLNVIAIPPVLSFGMGKSAVSHMILSASIAYKPQGFKFYYVDQRQSNGNATIPVSGEASAETYIQLAENKEQGPCHYTFVQGKGYVEFDRTENWSDFPPA